MESLIKENNVISVPKSRDRGSGGVGPTSGVGKGTRLPGLSLQRNPEGIPHVQPEVRDIGTSVALYERSEVKSPSPLTTNEGVPESFPGTRRAVVEPKESRLPEETAGSRRGGSHPGSDPQESYPPEGYDSSGGYGS